MNYVSNLIRLVLLPASLLGAISCEEYEPPPEVRLQLPEGGAFLPGVPLTVLFSKPIDPATLRVNIWPDERDIEGAFLVTTKPRVEQCTLAKPPCGDLTMTLADDKKSATLALDIEGLGQAGPPYVLDVMRGLADADGNDTGQSSFFDFQFRTEEVVNEDPVEFDDGTYILVGSVTQPLPAVLTLISDIKAIESGEFYLAGAEGDPISSDFPNNTRNPEELMVDETNLGFATFVSGFIQLKDGRRLMETQPTTIQIPLGPLTVRLEDVRVFGEIFKDERNKDRVEGTLSYTKVVLINSSGRETEYDGDATAITIDYVDPAVAPAGHPVVCGDLCGLVTSTCEPPTDYPSEDFCDTWDSEQ